MSTQLTALIRDAAVRLRERHSVDAGLDDVAREAEALDGSAATLAHLQKLLRDRSDALEQAAVDVRRLARATSRLRKILPFTEPGWPERLRRFEMLVAEHPPAALAEWLDYLDATASGYRLEALHRLVDQAPLPRGFERLRERATLCLAGLQERRYPVVEAVLADGTADETRRDGQRSQAGPDLRMLLARLCVADGHGADVDTWLGESTEPAALAIRAAAAGAAGDEDARRRLIDEARLRDATNLDVVNEAARLALLEKDFETAREIAETGIAALPSLVDVEHDLGRLIDPQSELWLAVAVRARAEGNQAGEEGALLSAELHARGGPNEHRIVATVADRRAEMTDGSTRVQYLLDAGERWTLQGALGTARLRFEEALRGLTREEDEPLWASVKLRWADCVSTKAIRDHQDRRIADFRRALGAIEEAQTVEGAMDVDPWSHAVEYDARSALAGEIDEARTEHLWRALLAAERAVALAPADPRMWLCAADAAGGIGLRELAIAAATYAEDELDAEDPEAIAAWSGASGRHDVTLERLQGRNDPWSLCLLADAYLHLGSAGECYRLLSTVTIDPSWTWARANHVSSAVHAVGTSLATALAARYLGQLPQSSTDYSTLVDTSFLALVAGDLPRAENSARAAEAAEVSEDQGQASFYLGLTLLCGGERERGRALIQRSLQFRDRSYLEDWRTFERKVALAVAAAHALPADVLGFVDDIVDQRLADGAGIDFARPDLARAAGVPDVVVDDAMALAEILLTVTSGHQARMVELASALRPELLDRLPSLRFEVEIQRVLSVLRGAARPGADDAVRIDPVAIRALGPDSADALSAALREEVDRGALEASAIQRLATELADVPDLADAAATAVEGSDGASGSPPDDERLWLYLPASWFDGHEDPTRTHPIFVRYLTELRLLEPGVPAVQVTADTSLEPDRYAISRGGEQILLLGAFGQDARTCEEAELGLLADHVRERAGPAVDGRVWIPNDAFEPADRVERLLTMDDQEFVVRQLGVAARLPTVTAAEDLPAP